MLKCGDIIERKMADSVFSYHIVIGYTTFQENQADFCMSVLKQILTGYDYEKALEDNLYCMTQTIFTLTESFCQEEIPLKNTSDYVRVYIDALMQHSIVKPEVFRPVDFELTKLGEVKDYEKYVLKNRVQNPDLFTSILTRQDLDAMIKPLIPEAKAMLQSQKSITKVSDLTLGNICCLTTAYKNNVFQIELVVPVGYNEDIIAYRVLLDAPESYYYSLKGIAPSKIAYLKKECLKIKLPQSPKL